MTAAVVDATLGELLSPSQVNTFLSCPAKWYFRYRLGLAEPATATLALGTAFHSVLAGNFRQKIESKQDLPIEELEESFDEGFAMAAEDAEFREDEAGDINLVLPIRDQCFELPCLLAPRRSESAVGRIPGPLA